MSTILEPAPGQSMTGLESPTRNRYYYGKLLDARHLEIEQDYGNEKRWLINRLSIGSGVLCGLAVTKSTDGTRVRVGPGVAIDPLGREILVPEPSAPLKPLIPEEQSTTVAGDRRDGQVTLYICYHECEIEPAPVLVATDCDSERYCENGLIRERYKLEWRQGSAPRPALADQQCEQLFGDLPKGTARYELACRLLAHTCAVSRETCVPIATLTVDAQGIVHAIDTCRYRRNLYSNAVLFDLIMCLAQRVDECCGHAKPPVINAQWPPNAKVLSAAEPAPAGEWLQSWRKVPRVELTFDRLMSKAQLDNPPPWLRVFEFRSQGQNEIAIKPLKVEHQAPPFPFPPAPAAGVTEVFNLGGVTPPSANEPLGRRYLVLVRAEANNIVDTSTPPLLLDAEYTGTQHTSAQLDQVWNLTGQVVNQPQAFWDNFVTTPGTLPSGDEHEGGRFRGWFHVANQ